MEEPTKEQLDELLKNLEKRSRKSFKENKDFTIKSVNGTHYAITSKSGFLFVRMDIFDKAMKEEAVKNLPVRITNPDGSINYEETFKFNFPDNEVTGGRVEPEQKPRVK